MSDNVDQENPSANDDNTDATNAIGKLLSVHILQRTNFFTYLGLNQQLV